MIVKKGCNDMVHDAVLNEGEGEGEDKFEILGAGVYWRIAKSGGVMIRSPPGNKKKRFAQRKPTKKTKK